MYTPEGTFDGAVFSSRDITARKRIEALHRESEERYNALFSRSHDCVYVHDFTGKFIDANEAALQLFGYTKDEVKNLDFQSILSEDQLPVAIEAMQESIYQRLSEGQKGIPGQDEKERDQEYRGCGDDAVPGREA